ncbi:hypothetical protein BDZ97DRAFT_1793241 [Flammula alnicola]|nr:hypothetical protein BDZ97DRAFT_1793241 [Flammula alnicola]
MITQQTKELHAFSMPPSWSSALDDVCDPGNKPLCGTHIVKGSKNSGKSTFARTLMNRLLEYYRRVAYLECDLGQSEFTPGGMVSLNIISSPIFGPPFTHPTLPNYAHFIGSTTPRSSPSHYLDAIHALIQKYRLDIQNPAIEMTDGQDPRIQDAIPIVVNTMGWSKGLGADLTQRIEDLIEATDVFNIQAPVREEYAVAVTPVLVTGTYGAYYSHTMMDSPPHITARSWDTSRPLCAVPPYEVDCTIALDKVMLTGAGSEDVVEEEIGRVLNGAVVGVVSCERGMIDLDATPQRGNVPSAFGIPYTQHHAPPPTAASNCFGIALIRGVSPPKTEPSVVGTPIQAKVKSYLQMLTPLPHPLLAQSRVLVKGEMELPVWGMLDFRNFNEGKDVDPGDVAGVERDKVPFLQWGKAPEGVIGAEKRKIRRNLMRRGQM